MNPRTARMMPACKNKSEEASQPEVKMRSKKLSVTHRTAMIGSNPFRDARNSEVWSRNFEKRDIILSVLSAFSGIGSNDEEGLVLSDQSSGDETFHQYFASAVFNFGYLSLSVED